MEKNPKPSLEGRDAPYGWVYESATGRVIDAATESELFESLQAELDGDGTFWSEEDGKRVFVADELRTVREWMRREMGGVQLESTERDS